MSAFTLLDVNKFVQTVLNDGREVLSDIKVSSTATELPDDAELDEYQYYMQKVSFYLVHALTWCKQLDLAIDFLSNYSYSSKTNSSRADHLIYNVENYLIRLNSVYDRVLQITNAVFHLGVDEEHVAHSVIVSNHKVKHRPAIGKKIKAVKNFLEGYSQARHTVIHRHSYVDAKLRRIEFLYLHDIGKLIGEEQWKESLKHLRYTHIRNYLAEKKVEFLQINDKLSLLLDSLFLSFLDEYVIQKRKLR